MPEGVVLLEQAKWPAFLVARTGQIRQANPAARALFGNHLPGAQLADIWPAENSVSAEQFLAGNEAGAPPLATYQFRTLTGVLARFPLSVCPLPEASEKLFLVQLFPTSTTPASNGKTGMARGQAVEVNVLQKQKLDCALQLTRTVALDFNNALTTILGHTSHLLAKLPPGNEHRFSLCEMEKAAEKAAEIATDLALFSLEDKEKRAQVAGNLNLILRRAEQLFQTPERAHLIWSVQFESRMFTVDFEEGKLQQAFVKILENAVEAVAESGQIAIQTRNLELTQPTQDRSAHLAAGTYVCVEIADDGDGIEPQILPRIFEPFFTTKYGHRGLGLAWAYGVVTNHRGAIAVSSQPGQGTSVRVYLPASKKIVEERVVRDESLAGTGTVLFVDDEEMVVTLGQLLLSSAGYRVLTATNAEKALVILQKTTTLIDLLITDMVMPGMNGRQLIEKVRAISPATRVLCATACVRSLNSDDGITYLQKPFNSQGLLRKVKQLLTETADQHELT